MRPRRAAEDVDVAAEPAPARVRHETVRAAQHSALPGAGTPDDQQELAGLDFEGHILERGRRCVRVCERHRAQRDRAHASVRSRKTTGTSTGASVSAGTKWSCGQRNGSAYQVKLLSPTIEQSANAAGAASTATHTSQSAVVIRRGR